MHSAPMMIAPITSPTSWRLFNLAEFMQKDTTGLILPNSDCKKGTIRQNYSEASRSRSALSGMDCVDSCKSEMISIASLTGAPYVNIGTLLDDFVR